MMEALKTKHGGSYTQMQYRIWSEVYANGMHTDLDNPPNNSMFNLSGSNTPSTKKRSNSTSPEVAQALSQAATQVSSAIVAAFTPKASTTNCSGGMSPAKIFEGRSKCYKQLADLQLLKSQGLLDELEYASEKDAIMVMLKKLK